MNVAVVYVYPMVNVRTYFPLAKRFAATYRLAEAGEPHALHVMANGADPQPADQSPFAGLSCTWHTHSNIGWDIGAFQWAAENIPCDLLVCLGAPVHFWRSGWLARMVESYLENGPAYYGCWGYTSPALHLRTSVFWLPPQLLQSYPVTVSSSKRSRYDFEHGRSTSMTNHTLKSGLECYMVTWSGIFTHEEWEANIGPDLQESLVYDQHTHR